MIVCLRLMDKSFVVELKEIAFELFTSSPCSPPAVAAKCSPEERQQLSAMAFPLPVFEGADGFAEFDAKSSVLIAGNYREHQWSNARGST